MTTELGNRINWLCETAGGSREDLSALCGVARAHLGNLVRGDRQDMTTGTALVVSEVFGCSLDWLIAGRGPRPSRERVQRAVEARREAFPIRPKRRVKAH